MNDFYYQTNCVGCPGPDAGKAIQEMSQNARAITRRTFLKHVDQQSLREVAEALCYADHPSRGLTMAREFHIGYYKSRFRGKPCFYFDHSRIEYIFLKGA